MRIAAIRAKESTSAFDIDAELCFFGASGCESMRVRIDIRIDSKCAFAGGIAGTSNPRNILKLFFAFDIEEIDAGIESSADLIITLANARVHDRRWRRTCRTCSVEFAA